MPLAALLSAIRRLVLDRLPIPEAFDERKVFFRGSFPELTAEEIADLAKIDPERLRIYTQTIFTGERSVLRNHFPITFSLLRARFDPDLDTFEFTRDLHAARPWKSHLTIGLTTNFVEYLRLDRPDILDRIPELGDVAELERLTVDISRAEDSTNSFGTLLEIDQLSAMTVGALMECPAIFPSYVRVHDFEYDVLAFRHLFIQNGGELPEVLCEQRRTFAVGGRSRALSVKWQAVSEPVFEFIGAQNSDEEFTLAELADAVIAGEIENQDEAELFKIFVRLLQALIKDGVLLVKAA